MFQTILRRLSVHATLGLVAVSAAGAALAQDAGQTPERVPLDRLESVYAVAADPARTGGLLLGTRFGLLRATPDGFAELSGAVPVAVIGLARLPGGGINDRTGGGSNDGTNVGASGETGGSDGGLVLSGYGTDGKPAGLWISRDGAASWSPLAPATAQPKVAVTSISISRGDPSRILGLSSEIMLSQDGGESWNALPDTPEKTFSVALAGADGARILAATMDGLMVSDDAGRTWARAYAGDGPVTAVASLGDGRLLAFVYGEGVIAAPAGTLDWHLLGTGFGERYLRDLAQGPDGEIYGIADTGAVLVSRDGGRNWLSFEGSDIATPGRIAAGRAVFQDNCQTCHGVKGIGEAPGNPEARDEAGFKAPALNDDMHAWHHSDAGLRQTISRGSPRNPRMIAWQDVLAPGDIDAVIAYIKSNWSINSLACQGARHMACLGN